MQKWRKVSKNSVNGDIQNVERIGLISEKKNQANYMYLLMQKSKKKVIGTGI